MTANFLSLRDPKNQNENKIARQIFFIDYMNLNHDIMVEYVKSQIYFEFDFIDIILKL